MQLITNVVCISFAAALRLRPSETVINASHFLLSFNTARARDIDSQTSLKRTQGEGEFISSVTKETKESKLNTWDCNGRAWFSRSFPYLNVNVRISACLERGDESPGAMHSIRRPCIYLQWQRQTSRREIKLHGCNKRCHFPKRQISQRFSSSVVIF